MAYLDSELQNARLIWVTIREKVLIIGLIMLAMALASVVSILLGHFPHKL